MGNENDLKSSLRDDFSSVILIIGKAENMGVLQRRIELSGYEVISVETPREGLETLKSRDIDLIFLEYNLAGEDMQVLRNLKDSKEYTKIPVITIAEKDDFESSVKAIGAGAEDYLVTPLNPTILKARFDSALARKKAHDAELVRVVKFQEEERQRKEKEQMDSLGNMAFAISQELKNPLNIVMNLSEISKTLCAELKGQIDKIFTPNDDIIVSELNKLIARLDVDLTKIYDQTKRADRIMRFMIDQATASRSEFYLTDINKVVTETITMFVADRKEIGKPIEAKIQLTLDNKVPKKLMICVQSLHQALYNILTNSVESLHEKGLDKEKALIEVNTVNFDERVDISVKDNGVGIETSLRNRIFEPFFTKKKDRPGLGLSAVNESIKMLHKGSITVKSNIGEYCEFILNIPKRKR